MLKTSLRISPASFLVYIFFVLYDDCASPEVIFDISGVGPTLCMNDCRIRRSYLCMSQGVGPFVYEPYMLLAYLPFEA